MSLVSSLYRWVATEGGDGAEFRRAQRAAAEAGVLIAKADDPRFPFEQRGWVAALISMIKREGEH